LYNKLASISPFKNWLGIPRISAYYGKECFKFSANFLRMTFPKSVADVASAQQVTPQVELLLTVISNEHSRKEIQESLKLSDRNNFSENYLKPALDLKVIEMTIPDKPQSSKQQYRLTALGKSLLK
tara:strand:+ start:1103 stop:1480 length:378 start_codon:yes stop_codon:yes gene_type:complete